MKGRTEKDYLLLLGGLVRLGATPLARQGRREVREIIKETISTSSETKERYER